MRKSPIVLSTERKPSQLEYNEQERGIKGSDRGRQARSSDPT
jgi:hypothetical protein